jgi:hypothetical protein
MIDIVCFKWGPKFGPEYVNNLYHAIQKYVTVPHRFICYTDDPTDVECETREFLVDLPVWWYIIGLTNPEHEHNDKLVYMDLDTIITGNIDHIIGLDKPFATISDFGWLSGLQTAYIMWNKEIRDAVWKYFTSKYEPKDYPNLDCDYTQWGGTNQFLEECMGVVRINKNPRPALTDFIEPPEVVRLQDEFPNECVSYKAQSLATVRTLPDTVNMVFFHGKPQPHEVDHTWPADNWIKEHWC